MSKIYEANSFKVTGGLVAQFLKGDGTLDSSIYYLASNPSGYITGTNVAYKNINNNFTSSQNITGFLDVSTELRIGGININSANTLPNVAYRNQDNNFSTAQTATSFNLITGLATATPLINGTAAVGTSTLVARQDHKHPTDTTRVAGNTAITAATKTKITYDSKGLITGGDDLIASDIPALSYAPASGSANYIQNQIASAQSADMWISGTASANNKFLLSGVASSRFILAQTASVSKWYLGSGTSFGKSDNDVSLYSYSGSVNLYNSGSVRLVTTATGVDITGTIQATTAKLTNLTDGYLPYHISDASGLGNSLIYQVGSNVGIGTVSPVGGGTALNIYGALYSTLKLTSGTTGATASDGTDIEIAGLDFILKNREVGTIKLYTSNLERLTIASGGNVLIGPTTDDTVNKLQVNGRAIINTTNSGLTINNNLAAGYSQLSFTGGAEPTTQWTILNGFPNNGNFTIRKIGAFNALSFDSVAGAATFASSVTAASLIKSGGLSTEYLMADGSVSTGGSSAAGGTSGQIQFNDVGALGGFGSVNAYEIDLAKPLLLEPASLHPNSTAVGTIYAGPEPDSRPQVRSYGGGLIPVDGNSSQTITAGAGQSMFWANGSNAYISLTASTTLLIYYIPDGASGTILVKRDATTTETFSVSMTGLTTVKVGTNTDLVTVANKHTTITYKRIGTNLILVYGHEQ